jgi:uncharacterized protein YgbK (DUF1537 family)
MTVVLGCIADDFTGATDIAGLLARSGAAVSLRIGVPAAPAADAAAFEVIALKIRTAPVAEAVAEAWAALAWLRQAGARRFFWKYCSTFDSTPQGNIGPVAEALLADLGAAQTIYCPAFPENGRSVFMGHLFVGEQLLNESPMKDHPLTPMRDASLVRLLRPQVTRPVGLVNRMRVAAGVAALSARLAELKAGGTAHVVVDAVADADLRVIAEACRDFPLITGGSAVAMFLPDLYRDDGTLPAHAPQTVKPVLDPGTIVLSGSCSAMTRRQVAAYSPQAAAYRLDPLVLHSDGIEPARVWLKAQSPDAAKIVYATAEPAEVQAVQKQLGVDPAGRLVEEAMAQLALDALELGVRCFVIAGGETAGAVTKALGVTRLTIGKEIAPGVPWTYCRSGGHDIALALKSGNFGAEDFFAKALDLLKSD